MFNQRVRDLGLAERFLADSAGTLARTEGKRLDPAAAKVAFERQYPLTNHQSRCVTGADFERFDYLIAVDYYNLVELQSLCPDNRYRNRLHLLLDYTAQFQGQDIPDPYKKSPRHFHHAMDLIEAGVDGLLYKLVCTPC